ncbi:hypothetical protein ACOME3_009228 [Neoechinorhynchus agilis]
MGMSSPGSNNKRFHRRPFQHQPHKEQSFAAAMLAYRSGGANRKRTISVGGISPLARLATRQVQSSNSGFDLSHSSLDDRRIATNQQITQIRTLNEDALKNRGNIFVHRNDHSQLLERIPIYKRTLVHTKFEDDGPFGNDESRIGLLSQLSEMEKTEVTCISCYRSLTIYDRYPLIDGTIFLSPIRR